MNNNGKVIYMNNPNDRIGERIRAAAKAAEEEYKNKIERSRAADVDVRNFFTDEELDALLSGNEFFNGRIADMERMERYKRACAAAKWLDDHSIDVINVDIEGVSSDRPNAIIAVDVRRLASLRDKELRVFTALTALADSVYLSGIKDNHIRFTFGVEGIWKE